MKRLLRALPFPMFVLAAVLFWEAYRAQRGTGMVMSPQKIQLYFMGAGIALGAGIITLRLRHRWWREECERHVDDQE